MSVWQTFSWLTVAGLIGVLMAVPLRRHYIDEEDLTFADGMAAGEALLVLDQGPKEAGPRVTALGVGMFASGLLAVLRDKLKLVPDTLTFGANGAALAHGQRSEPALVRLGHAGGTADRGVDGTGDAAVVGHRAADAGCARDCRGSTIRRGAALGDVARDGIHGGGRGHRRCCSSGSWCRRRFANLSATAHGFDRFSDALRGRRAWLCCPSLLCVLQNYFAGLSGVADLCRWCFRFFLMLVGTRVLGETNWAPVSAMANLMQAVFAVLSPGSMTVNMIGSGMSGTVAVNGETLMQDYKSGKIVGSNNRKLTILQLISVPVGSLAVALVYPALKARYGIGGNGLTSPISVKWAGFAELLNQGFSQLPPGCFDGDADRGGAGGRDHGAGAEVQPLSTIADGGGNRDADPGRG